MVSKPLRSTPPAALFVFAFCLVMIASSRGMGETYAIFLLPLSESFGWNRANVTSIFAIYMVAFGFGSLLSGLLYDRFGPRFNYTIGLALLAACYGFAGSLNSLVSFYFVIGVCGGIGAAMVGIVPTQSLISRWFDKRRGTVLSVAYSGQGLGVMLLAPAAQLAIQRFGWQQAYQLASIGFVVLFALMVFLPWRRIATGIIAPKHHAEAPATATAPGPSLAEAIRLPEFWGFFVIFGASAISVFGVSLQTVAYLVEHDFSAVHAALAFGSIGMLTVVGIALTGMLADRYPRHLVATGSYGLTIIGILALAMLQLTPHWAVLSVFVLCFGLSAGARGPIITAQMADIFAGRGLASIFGATNIGQGCGAALGAIIAGFLYDATGGYNTGFVVSLIFALVGLSMFWLVPAIRYSRPHAQSKQTSALPDTR